MKTGGLEAFLVQKEHRNYNLAAAVPFLGEPEVRDGYLAVLFQLEQKQTKVGLEMVDQIIAKSAGHKSRGRPQLAQEGFPVFLMYWSHFVSSDRIPWKRLRMEIERLPENVSLEDLQRELALARLRDPAVIEACTPNQERGYELVVEALLSGDTYQQKETALALGRQGFFRDCLNPFYRVRQDSLARSAAKFLKRTRADQVDAEKGYLEAAYRNTSAIRNGSYRDVADHPARGNLSFDYPPTTADCDNDISISAARNQ